MTFETYKNEAAYDSSNNVIDDRAAEQIARIKAKKIGATALDIFHM